MNSNVEAGPRHKVVVEAESMEQGRCRFISLVDRPANRIPFRILKSENGMINLAKLFTAKKNDAPAVVAVITPATTDQAALTEALAEHGVVVAKSEEKDGALILSARDDFELTEEATVLKMSDDMAVVIENVKKGFVSYPDSDGFDENMKQAGFLPGLHVATDVMVETVHNVLSSADAGEVATKVETILSEYTNYVVGLAQSIPATAFKMEQVTVAKSEAQSEQIDEEDQPDTAEKQDEEDTTSDINDTDGEDTATKSDDEQEDDLQARIDAQKAEDMGDLSDSTTKSEEQATTEDEELQADPNAELREMLQDGLNGLTEQIQTMGANIESVTKQVGDLSEEMTQVAQKAEQAAESAQAATQAVGGTLTGGETMPDSETAQKQDDQQENLFDSALNFGPYERR